MTDTPDLPPELAAKLAEIDRERHQLKGAISDAEERLQLLGRDRMRYEEAVDICRRAWCPPKFVGLDEADYVHSPGVFYQEGQAPTHQPPSERKRRDLRGEVLGLLFRDIWTSATAIATKLNVREAQVEKALAYHERDGRVEEHKHRAGEWRLRQNPERGSLANPESETGKPVTEQDQAVTESAIPLSADTFLLAKLREAAE